jgi:hypothetical protein
MAAAGRAELGGVGTAEGRGKQNGVWVTAIAFFASLCLSLPFVIVTE